MDSGDDEVIAAAMPTGLGRSRISASTGASWSPPPERRLVAAVLAQAIQDIDRGKPSMRRVLRAWFDNASDRPWGFVWCCDLLDLDADQVRHRLKQPMPANVRRGRARSG